MKQLSEWQSLEATDQLWSLACGPDRRVARYNGCTVNGFRIHRKEREQYRKTHNSGVVVKGEHQSRETAFYGVLIDIIELTYFGGNRVILFKCDLWDISNRRTRIHIDEYFTSVNVSHKWYKDDSFVLASQVEQVFYVSDTKLGEPWKIVKKVQPRNVYDVIEEEEEKDDEEEDNATEEEAYQQSESFGFDLTVLDKHNIESLQRDDVVPNHVNATIIQNNMATPRLSEENSDGFIDDDSSEDNEDTMLELSDDQVELLSTDDDTDVEM